MWPVDDTGKYSVSPSTIAKMIACRSVIEFKLSRNDQKCLELFDLIDEAGYDYQMADQNSVEHLNSDEAFARLRSRSFAHAAGYKAMYSSWIGGIITDPSLMIVPVDDHIVHRGDGVFEAIKFVSRKVYGLDRHLERLQRSMAQVALKPHWRVQRLKEIVLETCRASGIDDGLIRLYCSRGPGGFTTNPYESIGDQLYIIVTALKNPPEEKYEKGLTVRISKLPAKEAFWANIKSCNYLPNVMMKKESVDWGVDFTVSVDESGFVAESSTENCAIISADGEFLVPSFSRTLRGVTIARMMELAQPMIARGVLKGIREAHYSVDEIYSAKEMMMLGTTMDVLPVVRFENKLIGTGSPGPVYREFLKLIREDLSSDRNEMITRL